MTKADSVHSTPPTNSPISPADATSRRRFLSSAAGMAAGGTALALAIPPTPAAAVSDPVFALIEIHGKADAAVGIVVAELIRRDDLDEPDDGSLIAGPSHDENVALADLLEAVPTTLAGIVAWVTYLTGVAERGPWKVDDTFILPLLSGLATAFENGAVAS